MNRASAFSYTCNQCGLCCRDKVITLSPYDIIRMARAASITTGEALARYTARRGSLLRFVPGGRCAALDGACCGIHPGRPLACRLYPLGLERAPAAGGGYVERYVRLEPAPGSLGVYGNSSTVPAFLDGQQVPPYLDAIKRYRPLIADFRRRVHDLVDFERVEPREFWRHAMREALRESGYDSNPLIDALFDPDSLGCGRADASQTMDAHVSALREMLAREGDGARAAAAAMMLSISLGYVPGDGWGVAGVGVGE